MSEAPAQGGRPKTRYRTRNWREYDQGLISRGDLTVWISPDLVWHAAEGTSRRGRPPVFTDAAIQTVLTLKALCQLPLRAAQGMAGSLIRLARLGWKVRITAPSRVDRRAWPSRSTRILPGALRGSWSVQLMASVLNTPQPASQAQT